MITIQSLIATLQQLDPSLPIVLRLNVFDRNDHRLEFWPASAPYVRQDRRSVLSVEDVRIVNNESDPTLGCEIVIPVFVEASGDIERLEVGLIKPAERHRMRYTFGTE